MNRGLSLVSAGRLFLVVAIVATVLVVPPWSPAQGGPPSTDSVRISVDAWQQSVPVGRGAGLSLREETLRGDRETAETVPPGNAAAEAPPAGGEALVGDGETDEAERDTEVEADEDADDADDTDSSTSETPSDAGGEQGSDDVDGDVGPQQETEGDISSDDADVEAEGDDQHVTAEPELYAFISEPMPAGDIALVGLRFEDEGVGRAHIRVAKGGEWDPWEEVGLVDEGPDPGTAEDARAEKLVTDPVWVGRVDHIQVMVESHGEPDISLEAVTIAGDDGLAWEPDNVPGAALAAAKPDVITRAQWDPNNQCSPRKSATINDGLDMAVIHHTASSNGYTKGQAAGIVLAICQYHRNSLGWNDVGYNMLVDRFGRSYEGRAGGLERVVQGAHALGWNKGSFGISVIGCFHYSCSGDNVVPQAALDAVDRAVAWKFAHHGVDPQGTVTRTSTGGGSNRFSAGQTVTLPTIIGHLDVGYTACPGSNFDPKVGGADSMGDRVAQLNYSPIPAGAVPVVGDWNGDGKQTPGWFDEGMWYQVDERGGPIARSFRFGRAGDVPIVGDWNGDGMDTIGVHRGREWILRNDNSAGSRSATFTYGRESDTPIVGDWNADGTTTIGVVRRREWILRNSNSSGPREITAFYGKPSDTPIVGDWNGDGATTIGVHRGREWILRNHNSSGSRSLSFRYGRSSDTPIVGDWVGGTGDGFGVVRGSTWLLRTNATGGAAELVDDYG